MSAAKPAPHLALFLQAVHGIHASGAGTKETSYYTALNNVLDGVGAALSPTVHSSRPYFHNRHMLGTLACPRHVASFAPASAIHSASGIA